jgi:hypothetical protein
MLDVFHIVEFEQTHLKENFEDTKGVNQNPQIEEDRQYNGQRKKDR